MGELLPGVLEGTIDEKSDDIFKFYDFEKSTNDNLKALCENFDAKELANAVTYIKTQYKESHQLLVQRVSKSRNKMGIAGDIKSFLNGILPIKCEACNDTYCHTETVNTEGNEVTCLICKRFSHKQCYADKPVPTPQRYYICSICVDSIETRKQAASQANKEQNDIDQLDLSYSDRMSSVSSPGSQEEIPSGQGTPVTPQQQDADRDKRMEDARRESEGQICPLYLKAECPHGLRGRNCSYEHPRRCRRYCSYGTQYKFGCRRGKNCWYWHPNLCLNSVRLKMCLNQNCKDVHLKGTQRRQVPRENITQREHEIERPQRPDPWSQDPTQNNNLQTDKVQSMRPNDQNDFLRKQLEQMKADIQTSMSLKIDQIDQKKQLMIQQSLLNYRPNQLPQQLQQITQQLQQQIPGVYIQR